MMIGAFKQDRIPEAVTKPQIDANRRKHIGQHSFTGGLYFNFFHTAFHNSVSKARRVIKNPGGFAGAGIIL
jgi:hypothetical protein